MESRFFSVYFSGKQFEPFSSVHLISLSVLLIACILLYVLSNKIKSLKIDKPLRDALAYILIATELSFQIWCSVGGVWTPKYNLPFHLCSAATIICIVMLLKKSYKIFELAYYWGLAGAGFALITPDLSGYNYPHYVFFKYFILHSFIIISILYMAFIYDYVLSFKTVLRAFIATNLFAIVVIPINILTGGNYLFLCRKPDVFTLLDYFGSWPRYIIPMEIIVIIVFYVLYIPFALKKHINKSNNIDMKD